MSDPDGIIASPLETILIDTEEGAIEAIVRLAGEYQVGSVVAGMPYSLSGAAGPAAAKVQEFVAKLAAKLKVPITTWDERLSTVAANRSMRDSGVKRSKQKGLRDAVAAALILEAYLDRQRSSRP